VLLVAVVGGVVWSNALQYRDVDLAPRGQLAELKEIGRDIEGQGPTLITEYQPYAARHFLRDADPEAASELRRRPVALAGGGTLRKGEYADIDRFALGDLLVYRTLVLRRSPAQSRPPSAYALARRDQFYEVWQRSESPGTVIEHLSLGDEVDPVATPSCGDVAWLAGLAGPRGALIAASRPAVLTVSLDATSHPEGWDVSDPAQPRPTVPGSLTAAVRVSRSGNYEVWLEGSVRPRVELLVDGRRAGEVRHQLNNAGLYVRLGEANLDPGRHEVAIRFHGADLHPGSGGSAPAIGPLVLSDSDAAESRLTEVPAGHAEHRLCDRPWDWIEVADE
jgi:hypothetical protein